MELLQVLLIAQIFGEGGAMHIIYLLNSKLGKITFVWVS